MSEKRFNRDGHSVDLPEMPKPMMSAMAPARMMMMLIILWTEMEKQQVTSLLYLTQCLTIVPCSIGHLRHSQAFLPHELLLETGTLERGPRDAIPSRWSSPGTTEETSLLSDSVISLPYFQIREDYCWSLMVIFPYCT